MFKQVNIRSNFLIILLTLFVLATFTKCSKEQIETSSVTPPKSSQRIQSLRLRNSTDVTSSIKKVYYARNFDDSLSKAPDKIKYTPDWQNPIVCYSSDSSIHYLYPLQVTIVRNGAMVKATESGISSFLIVKNAQDFYRGVYVESKVTDQKLTQPPLEFLKTFNGNLELHNLSNRRFAKIPYYNGKVTYDYKQVIKQRGLSRSGHYEEICITTSRCTWNNYCVNDPVVVTVTEGCYYPPALPSSQCREWQLSYDEYFQECTLYWYEDAPENPGEGGGGGGGDYGYEITDDFDNYPCAKSLVAKMKTMQSSLANLIRNSFDVHDEINLNFFPDATMVNTSVDGNLNSVSGHNYQIGINPDVLTKATNEYIIVTLYHEALHAYFAEKLKELGQAAFDQQFLGLQVNGGRLLAVVNDQHTPLGYNKYVTGLRDVILAYNPNFDISRAAVLAQAGIILSSANDTNINKQERDTTDPNHPGATGTKCQ